MSKFPNCGEWQWAAPSISFRREELSRGGHSVGGEPEVGGLTGALEQCATGWRVGTGIALEAVSKLKIFDSCLGAPIPLRVMSVNVHVCSVGRPGLDPGTLGVFPERPGTSISVQIHWSDEGQCPPTSTDVLSCLTSWLDNWLDRGSFQGQVTVRFRDADGEGFNMRRGDG